MAGSREQLVGFGPAFFYAWFGAIGPLRHVVSGDDAQEFSIRPVDVLTQRHCL